MATSIHAQRLNHMNVVYRDFDASVRHYKDLFDAEFVVDMPQSEWHVCLMAFGNVLFEFFIPEQWLTNARYGPHFVGLEYQANIDEVRAALDSHGIGIVRDIGQALHTEPRDCFGISFEFYGGSFHERNWDDLGGKPFKGVAYWRDEHPMGLTGLVGYSVVVADLDAGVRFMESFLSAREIYREDRPDIGAKAVGLRVSDDIVELLRPVGDGEIAQHHYRYGDGVRATRFGARDLGRVRDFFAAKGVEIVPGDIEGSLVLRAEDNLGVIFEFIEQQG